MRVRVTLLDTEDTVLFSDNFNLECQWGQTVAVGQVLAEIAGTHGPFPDGTVAVVRPSPSDAALDVLTGTSHAHPALWSWRNRNGSLPAAFLDASSGRPAWNPTVDSDTECHGCGHDYSRHFDIDTWDDGSILPVGCKYCTCPEPTFA